MSGAEFASAPSRIAGEADRRRANAARVLPYHHSFLDDCLRGILPHDLVLLGAETGAGKTDITTAIAKANARAGKRVHYFALEAEPDEIERRIKFTLIVELATKASHPRASELNYLDWIMCRCAEAAAPFERAADQLMLEQFGRLHTYYRGERFGAAEIQQHFRAVAEQTDLIALDHLHYVDVAEDETEHRALGSVVKMIRHVALGLGRPVLLVAHLRKRDMRARQIVPHMEDFSGSSELIKNCTAAILLAPAHCIESPRWYLSPTFVYVPKHRAGGATGLVALCWYDRRSRTYLQHYTLGRAKDGGTAWEEISMSDVPRWAVNHRPSQGAQP